MDFLNLFIYLIQVDALNDQKTPNDSELTIEKNNSPSDNNPKTKNKKEIVKYKQNKENNLINLSFNGLIY